MGATAVFTSNSISQFASFSAFTKPKLGIIRKEISYGPSSVPNRRDNLCSTVSSIKADGTADGSRRRRSKKDVTPEKSLKGEEINIQLSPDSKSSQSLNQEEIISLFKRIQSSISKGDSSSSKKRRTKSSEEKPTVDAVLEVLRHSKERAKGTTSNMEDKVVTTRKGQKEPKTDYSSELNPRSTRPPSSFVKRSPIRSPSSPKENVVLKAETSTENHDDREAIKIEGMKLPQLKELAKSRGLKGYSKLKKSELVELLLR